MTEPIHYQLPDEPETYTVYSGALRIGKFIASVRLLENGLRAKLAAEYPTWTACYYSDGKVYR